MAPSWLSNEGDRDFDDDADALLNGEERAEILNLILKRTEADMDSKGHGHGDGRGQDQYEGEDEGQGQGQIPIPPAAASVARLTEMEMTDPDPTLTFRGKTPHSDQLEGQGQGQDDQDPSQGHFGPHEGQDFVQGQKSVLDPPLLDSLQGQAVFQGQDSAEGQGHVAATTTQLLLEKQLRYQVQPPIPSTLSYQQQQQQQPQPQPQQ
jgi:hypothetical protein